MSNQTKESERNDDFTTQQTVNPHHATAGNHAIDAVTIDVQPKQEGDEWTPAVNIVVRSWSTYKERIIARLPAFSLDRLFLRYAEQRDIRCPCCGAVITEDV